MQQALADTLLVATSEAEAMNYLAQLPMVRDGLISVCLRVPDSDEASYARVWRGKAAVAAFCSAGRLSSSARLPRILPPDATLNRGATSAASSPSCCWPPPTAAIIPSGLPGFSSSQQRRSASSAQLAAVIPEFARHQALDRSPYTKLVEALPEHTVVLDLVSFTRFEWDPQIKGKKGERRTPSYIGFVLAKGRPVRQVDLGPAAPIDEAVRAWRKAIKGRTSEPRRRDPPPPGLGAAGAALHRPPQRPWFSPPMAT